MIFFDDEKSDRMVAEIQKDDLTEKFECRLSVCENPACRCDTLYLELLPVAEGDRGDPSRRPHRMAIRLAEKELDFEGKFPTPEDDLDFARPFLAAMDEQDFRYLRERHYVLKNQICETAPLDSIDFPFDYERVERDGAMYAYNDPLPYGDQMTLTVGGWHYMVLDHFCLLPHCSCRDITLSMLYLDPDDKAKNEFHSVGLNYQEKKWIELDPEASSLPLAAVRSAFEEQIPDLYEKLPARHVKIKAIYRLCKRKHFVARQAVATARVGRNDPCPCGSGKKYKKCCLGKERS
jgi:hypothetical protein